jgi:hypothetical protein
MKYIIIMIGIRINFYVTHSANRDLLQLPRCPAYPNQRFVEFGFEFN